MASRSIGDLSLTMQALAQAFADACRNDDWLHANGVTVLITCTYRSPAEQEELYKIGRSKPGRIVTRAHGGESAHNVMAGTRAAAEAFDIVPCRHGKPVWGTSGNGIDDDPSDDDRDDLEVWQRVGQIAKRVGLKWYGDPDASFREFPHMQNPDWSRR